MNAARLLLLMLLLGVVANAEEIRIKTRSGILIQGDLKSQDEKGVTVTVAGKVLRFEWRDLSPKSCYELRRRVLPREDARARFELGRFCLENGLLKEAEEEFAAAVALDETYREKARALLDSAGNAPKPESKLQRKQAPKRAPELFEKNTPPPRVAKPSGRKKEEGIDEELSQELVVLAQKEYLKKVTEAMRLPFCTVETKHYLVHATFNKTVTSQIGALCEQLYASMSKVFDVKKRERLWDGKCVVFVFENRSDFVRYATDFDGFSIAEKTGGYFRHSGRMVHIAIPVASYDREKNFKSTLVHEAAHAFLQLFRQVVHISPWIHEGVAQYFEHQPFEHEFEWKYKKSLIRRQSAKELLALAKKVRAMKAIPGDDLEAYAYSWSVVTFVVQKNPKKFAKFILALKEGDSETEALKKAFRWNWDDLDREWVVFAKKFW